MKLVEEGVRTAHCGNSGTHSLPKTEDMRKEIDRGRYRKQAPCCLDGVRMLAAKSNGMTTT